MAEVIALLYQEMCYRGVCYKSVPLYLDPHSHTKEHWKTRLLTTLNSCISADNLGEAQRRVDTGSNNPSSQYLQTHNRRCMVWILSSKKHTYFIQELKYVHVHVHVMYLVNTTCTTFSLYKMYIRMQICRYALTYKQES